MAKSDFEQLIASTRAHPDYEKRMEERRFGEDRARAVVESKLGHLTVEDVDEFSQGVNREYHNGKVKNTRFRPALIGHNRLAICEDMDALNEWVTRLWQAEDHIEALTEFWAADEVRRAGKSFPTLLLYVKDPNRFTPWLGGLRNGAKDLTGTSFRREKTGPAYEEFNSILQKLRQQHGFAPQEMDLFLILWTVALKRDAGPAPGPGPSQSGFTGFSPDAFSFLTELRQNNSKAWMDAKRSRYSNEVKRPMRALATELAATLVAPVLNEGRADPLETRIHPSHVMSVIQRNSFGQGDPYHTYVWFAFYRQSRLKKQKDVQLFVVMRPEGIRFGFYVGRGAADVLKTFKKRISKNAQFIWDLLVKAEIPSRCEFLYTQDNNIIPGKPATIDGPEELKEWAAQDGIDVLRNVSPDDPLATSRDLLDSIVETIRTVYPLFLIATEDDWQNSVQQWLEDPVRERGDLEVIEPYSQEQFLSETLLDQKTLQTYKDLLALKPQLVFYGVPGTGKTFIARKLARLLTDGDEDRVKLVQFHPSYAYEDFIEGIRPRSTPVGDRMEISYPIEPGALKELSLRAAETKEKYVLLIDEINRGNVSRIFGELLYLLEYRGEAMDLPYSRQPLIIPENLYVIGTMNSLDRSIALVDYALRRRFNFIEILPSEDVLDAWYEEHEISCPEAIAAFQILNDQLHEDGIGQQFLVGHSYFMVKGMDLDVLRRVWEYGIRPLIEEYFFSQQDRIQRYRFETILKKVQQASTDEGEE